MTLQTRLHESKCTAAIVLLALLLVPPASYSKRIQWPGTRRDRRRKPAPRDL